MDLRSGLPFWAIHSGTLGIYPPLTADASCEVAIVGAGVTGALVAHRLSADGRACVVLDKRDAGWGSTMASTALIQYEIDAGLVALGAMIGRDDAALAYRLSVEGVRRLARTVATLHDACGFAYCRSLYLANAPGELDALDRECEARRALGIEVRMVHRAQLRESFGIDRPGALDSALAARVEPFRLTHRLLAAAAELGTRVFDRTAVTGLEARTHGGWTLHTDRGARVTAQRVVFASGYESQSMLTERLADLFTTFALATEPLDAGALWRPPPRPDEYVLWETGDPYFYMRQGPSGRLLMGGADVPFEGHAANQRLLARKTDELLAKAAEVLGLGGLEVAQAWCGVFGKTRDGLGYFGQSAELPGVDFVLGFGGNGITFSVVMADMLARRYAGGEPEGARLLRFGRHV